MKRLCSVAWFLLAGMATAAAAPPPPYATKPEWWDAVRVTVAPADSAEESIRRSEQLPENQLQEEKLTTGWQVLGPFDARDGDQLLNPMPGEELDFRRSWRGKDGATVRWQPWLPAEGKPLPPSLQSFSALFFLEFPGRLGERRFLSITHDDGAVVFLNGALISKNLGGEPMPMIIPVTLRERNRLLVRLNQGGGPWGLQLAMARENPLWKPAKLQSEAVRPFLATDPAGCAPAAERLGQIYARLRDPANASHWYRFAIRHQPDAAAALRVFTDAGWRLDWPGNENGATTFRLALALDAQCDNGIRRAATLQLLERLINSGQCGEALAFLTANEATLRPALGPYWPLSLARLHLLTGDWRQAEKEIRGLAVPEQDGELKRQADTVRGLIENSQKTALQLPRDLELEEVQRETAMLAQGKQTGKLVETISAVLKGRGGLLVESGEPALLLGAALRYRELFQPYAELYETQTRQLAAALARGAEGRGKEAALLFSLQMPAPAPTPSPLPPLASVAPALAQVPRQGFAPRLALPPGEVELRLEETPQAWGEGGGAAAATGICPAPTGAVFVQNSRQLCRLDPAGAVAWRRGFDNAPLVGVDSPARLLGDRFAPKTDGARVYARLLEGGRFAIHAFAAADGTSLWRWDGGEAAACSDPVLTDAGSILFLAARFDVLSRYYLVALDAATGAPEFELLLCSAAPEIALAGLGPARLDLFMPEPTVRNGMAFVNTNLGAVFAVNLRWRCLQWARTYHQAPFAINQAMTELAWKRRSCPPVAGPDTVLFAPRDGATLLLVDQRTGRLAKELPLATWTDCRAAGDAAAFLLRPDGSGTFLALTNLAATRPVAGRIAAILDSCRDGIILARNGMLECWPTNGPIPSATTPLPTGFAPLALAPTVCWGFLPAADLPVLGVATETPGAGDPARLTAGMLEPPPGKLANPFLLRDGADLFLVSDQAVGKFDAALQLAWLCPTTAGGGRPSLRAGPRTVYVGLRNGFLALDRATGRWLRRFPEGKARANWGEVFQTTLAGDDLLVVVRRRDWSSVDLLRFTRDGSASLGVTPSNPYGFFASGELLCWKDGKFRILRRAATGDKFDEVAVTPTPARGDACVRRAAPDSFLILEQGKATIARASGFTPVNLHQWGAAGGDSGGWWWSPDWRKLQEAQECIPLLFWNNGYSLINCRTGTDVAGTAPFIGMPSAPTPTLYAGPLAGESGGKKPSCTLGVLDSAAGRLLYRKNVPLHSLIAEWQRPNYDLSSFLDDGRTLCHFFNLGDPRGGGPAAVALDDLKPESPLELCPFPFYERLNGAAATAGNFLLAVDSRLVRFTRAEFLDLLRGRGAGAPPVTTLDPAPAEAKVTVDGFLDEWPAAAFTKARLGEYALRWSPGNRLHVALKLTDPAILRDLANHGAEGRLACCLLPAPYAGFRPELVAEQGVELVMGRKGDPGSFSYAVTPDGTLATAELELPLQKAARFDLASRKGQPRRDRDGDLAFDFQLRNAGEPPLSLLGSGAAPTALPFQYPRLLLRFK